LIGWLGPRLYKGAFPPPPRDAGHATHAADASPAFIGDDTPTPLHAQLNIARLVFKSGVFALLLLGPLAVLEIFLGHDHLFSRMGRFFTIASFSTIGGAYAVLPYVTEMSTRFYRWLRPGQMMDGLALGETTPGPLILVLTFVGFVGAWNVTFATMGYAGALAGAAIATYFTFLPSFLFIMLGGPFVERTRGEIAIGAVLSCITAAVVGAIVNMELFFTLQYLFPEHAFDWRAVLLVLLAGLALFWRKWESIAVVGACGVLGVLEFALRNAALH
jgi:chromate transporter